MLILWLKSCVQPMICFELFARGLQFQQLLLLLELIKTIFQICFQLETQSTSCGPTLDFFKACEKNGNRLF